MTNARDLVRRHFDALLAEARAAGVPVDVAGRTLLGELVQVWSEERAWTDVADELRFTADSLDPDRDFEFMRP